jgi:hypothetical protein
LLDNIEISLRDFNRKFNIKKIESLKILKTIRENKLIKYHPLFEVLAKEEAKAKNKTVDSQPLTKKPFANGFICSRLYIKPKFNLIIFYSGIDLIFICIN